MRYHGTILERHGRTLSDRHAYLPLTQFFQKSARPAGRRALPRCCLYGGVFLLVLCGVHFWLLYAEEAAVADRVSDHIVSRLDAWSDGGSLSSYLAPKVDDAECTTPTVFLQQHPRKFSLPYMQRTLLVAMPFADGERWRDAIEAWTGLHTGSVYKKEDILANDARTPREGDGVRKQTKVPFLFTHQPLQTHQGRIDQGWSSVLHLVRNPYEQIVAAFRAAHKETTTLDAEIFRAFALATARQWREHYEFWERTAFYDSATMSYKVLRQSDLTAPAALQKMGQTVLQQLRIKDPWFIERLHCGNRKANRVADDDLALSKATSALFALDPSIETAVFHLVNPYACRLGFPSPSGLPCTRDKDALHTQPLDVPRLLSLSVPAVQQPPLLLRNATVGAQEEQTKGEGMQMLDPLPKTVTYPENVEIHLLFSFYREEDSDRRQELADAFLSNLNNPYIQKMHVFLDCPDDRPLAACANESLPVAQTHPKLVLKGAPTQRTYKDFIAYANTHLASQVVVLHNADIIWTASIKYAALLALQRRRASNKEQTAAAFVLSRHANVPDLTTLSQCAVAPNVLKSHNHNMCLQYRGSHDAFLFVPPLAPAITEVLDFKQNTWGAENAVIRAFRSNGIHVYNPCASIVSVHNHCSGMRKHTAQRLKIEESREEMWAGRAMPALIDEFCQATNTGAAAAAAGASSSMDCPDLPALLRL